MRHQFFPRTTTLLLVMTSFLALSSYSAHAQNFGFNRPVGGIAVDANGVLRQVTVAERDQQLNQLRQQIAAPAGELNRATEMRKVSLRGLEAALKQAMNGGQGQVPEDVLFLAGLQRIEYVLVYPEQGDIVLAGPGEGWTMDPQTNVVGATTGRPVLLLEDLLVAFGTVEAARREGISVSIDPTPEGRQNFRRLISQQSAFTPAVLTQIQNAMGPQQVSYTGVPVNTHFARVLVAADYRMKRLAMNLEPAPIDGLPGFLDLLSQRRRTPSNAMPRWWLACNYEPLVRSEDKLAWQLRGQGVKAMTEDEFVQADGSVLGTGREDPIAKQWADNMTERFEPLAEKDIVFAQLRNLMDLCIVAALIESEDLRALAGGTRFPTLTGGLENNGAQAWNAPKTVPTQCSFVKIGRNYVITASGGVQIDSWSVASRNQVDPAISQVLDKATQPADSTWWWN
jgi:hypothetical protein